MVSVVLDRAWGGGKGEEGSFAEQCMLCYGQEGTAFHAALYHIGSFCRGLVAAACVLVRTKSGKNSALRLWQLQIAGQVGEDAAGLTRQCSCKALITGSHFA